MYTQTMKIAQWYVMAMALISINGTARAMNKNNSNMLMGQSLESFLSGLVMHDQLLEEHMLEILDMAAYTDDISDSSGGSEEIQMTHNNTTTLLHDDLDSIYNSSNAKQHYRDEGFTTSKSKNLLRDYLYNTVYDGTMDKETAEEIASSLSLGGLFFTQEMIDSLAFLPGLNGPASADYVGEGNIHRVGNILPVSVTDNSFVNGIWGYATPNGAREYALMCAGAGFSIIDVTNAAEPVRVQFTPMSGGGIWRDVCTHVDGDTGVTYAYVAAQGKHGGGNQPNLFVFDLSWLSDDAERPNGEDSNPIPQGDNGYNDLGETGYGHTINCARGLLFLNTAKSSSGCRVYDVAQDPMQPKFLFSTAGRGGCHDSMVQTDVDVDGETKDLWIISEAYSRRESIRDITSVNSNTRSVPPLISTTPPMAGIYAHSSVLYKDRYLFQTEEDNLHDISVYDIGDIHSPKLISRFQHSEHDSLDAFAHNGFIRGDYYYNAYYQAGLRVFDISNPYHVHEVGKVETYRDPDGDGKMEKIKEPSMDGCWNVYVDLPSQYILVNDMYNGLFIVKASAPYDPPQSPMLNAARTDSGDVNLSWMLSDHVRGYSVERSFDGSSYSRIAEHLIGTSYVDASNNMFGKSVFYRLIAVNGEGVGISDSVYLEATPGDFIPPTHAPTQSPTHGSTQPGGGGPQVAVYSEELKVPMCLVGSSCDSQLLLDGREDLGPEKNQPNTLDSCFDGWKGEYQVDESVDSIFVSSDSGEDMIEGSAITVKAYVWCWKDGKNDFVYFSHTSDATFPSWTLKSRVQCTGGGRQSLAVSYDLPEGTLQGIRISIRYEEEGDENEEACGFGKYDDNDDIVIQVKEDPTLNDIVDVRAKEEVEIVQEHFEWTEGGTKQYRTGKRKRKQQLRKSG